MCTMARLLLLAGLCLGALSTPARAALADGEWQGAIDAAIEAAITRTPDRAGELQGAIDAAITRGGAVQVPVSGEYFFGNRTLLIQGATDLAMVATSPTTFWFAGHLGGVRVRDSRNVTISGRNLTGTGGIRIDRAPKPYTQGTITARGGTGPPTPPGPPMPLPPGGCYIDNATGPVSYKFAPGNVFPDAPNHGVRLTDTAAGCCKTCLSFKNCSFYTFEHGGTAAQPTCYSKPGGCCFLKTAAAAAGRAPGQPNSISGSTAPRDPTADRVSFSVDGDSADPRTLTPASDPDDADLDGPLCTGWKNGSRSADGRPGSRGPSSNLGCLKPADAIQVGGSASRDFYCDKGCLASAEVGDQFLLFVWKGFTYNIENSTAITTEDLAIHASGYMGVYEADGGGGHVYRRFTLAPRNGMIIAANADGIHSSNCDRGPTIENSVIKSLLDDFFNIQTTMQLVWARDRASPSSGAGTHTLTVVHPHVSDQPVAGHTEQWYGTSEPFSRVRKGDALILYDPDTFKQLGTVTATNAALLLSPSSDVTSPIGKQADALYPSCCPKFLSFQPERYGLQRWRSSVYEVAVDGPLPAAAANLTVPYVLQIARTAQTGTVLRNNVFEDSRGFFGRWKSSNSRIENCTFRGSAEQVLELQMLPSHYEAPITISNITIVGNTFEVSATASIDDVFQTGPPCCKVQGFYQHGNRLVRTATGATAAP